MMDNSNEKRAIAKWDAAPQKTFLARLFDIHTEERAWRIGGQGGVITQPAVNTKCAEVL